MMRSAKAICTVYTDLNSDLLITGILFHDCGKMWENTYPETGFAQPYDLQGEMLGHIPLGIDLCGKLWNEMVTNAPESWADLFPLNEDVRIHLLHLIASHHGTYEFGSPTLPRTPEAIALHYIDNLDAKYEMFKQAYNAAPELAPGIQQKQFPLPANLVAPLAAFPRENADAPAPPAPVLKEEEPLPEAPKKPRKPKAPSKKEENPELEDELQSHPFTGELF
jgi:3'-5' exoribonuclease